jgi:hypothetical protein
VRPAPPPQLVLEIAGLSAEALTFVALTLLILAVMVEVTAPGPVGGWPRARRKPRPPTQPQKTQSPDQGAANTADREA